MRLLTNNPAKRVGLDGYGLQIVERVPLQPTVNNDNRVYLDTKRDKMGHILDSDEATDISAPHMSTHAAEEASSNGIVQHDEQLDEQNERPDNAAL